MAVRRPPHSETASGDSAAHVHGVRLARLRVQTPFVGTLCRWSSTARETAALNYSAEPMRRTVQTLHGKRHARGVTIVEVLVAFVVLSIGMLGIAGLFAVTLRTSGTAIQRVAVVDLASDIADRIRANRRAGEAYAVEPVASDDKCVGESSVTCSPEEMAKNDVLLWRRQIARIFPGGNAVGTIAYQAGSSAVAPSTYTIRIKWGERARNSNELYEPLEYRLDIQTAAY